RSIRVVNESGRPKRLRDTGRQAEGRVPLRADGARLRGRAARGREALGARGLEVTREVVGVVGPVAVEVGARNEIALRIPAARAGNLPRAACRRLRGACGVGDAEN